MDINAKKLGRIQLENLAENFETKDGKELTNLILQTCAALMGTIEKNTPAAELSDKDIEEIIHNYTVVYHVMNTFIAGAAKKINVESVQRNLDEMKDLYKNEQARLENAKAELEKTTADLENTKTQIEGIYSSNNVLLKDYESATDKLAKLNKLQAEFSKENLTAAELECVRLEEETNALQERQNVINEHTAECLGEISNILEGLKERVTTEQETANAVSREADSLRKAITALSGVYEEYSSWFNVLKTPAQQLEKDIGKAEMDKLREVVDEKTLAKKNELVSQTESNLKTLSNLVAACSRASQMDQKNITKNAGK